MWLNNRNAINHNKAPLNTSMPRNTRACFKTEAIEEKAFDQWEVHAVHGGSPWSCSGVYSTA
jgi:hypothetical protein